MNIAIVVDDLIQKGGQERVVTAVSEMWPNAPIYTTQASDYWKNYYKKRGVTVISSFMERLPFAQQLNRYYFPLLFHVIAFERFNFTKFDLVLSISSRYAHFALTNTKTTHVCIMNSPGRMFWETEDYFANEEYGLLRPIKFMARWFLSIPLSYLRSADFAAAQRIDYILANSINSQRKIEKYYKRSSEVIYPFSDTKVNSIEAPKGVGQKYFVLITRLSPWKRVDIAVEACTNLKINLKIIGGGPDIARLQRMAGPTIEFLGPIDDAQKEDTLSKSRGLIQTQREDFGIVPIEAMAMGKPVLAFGEGGVLETVVAGVTGKFYYSQTAESLENALKTFFPDKYDSNECIKRASKFSREAFKKSLSDLVAGKIV